MAFIDPYAASTPRGTSAPAPSQGYVYVPGLGVVPSGGPQWATPSAEYAPMGYSGLSAEAEHVAVGLQPFQSPEDDWGFVDDDSWAQVGPYQHDHALDVTYPAASAPPGYLVPPYQGVAIDPGAVVLDRSPYEAYWYDEEAFAAFEHERALARERALAAGIPQDSVDNWLANFMMPIMYFGDHLFFGIPHEISAGIAGLTGIFSEEGFGGRRDRVRDMLLSDMRAYEQQDPGMAAMLRIAGDVPFSRFGVVPGAIEEITIREPYGTVSTTPARAPLPRRSSTTSSGMHAATSRRCRQAHSATSSTSS